MKSIRKVRDYRNRYFYKKLEIFKKLLGVLFFFNCKIRSLAVLVQKIASVLIHKMRIKNYCVVTGRPRAVYRRLKVSRIVLRDLGASGLFFGLKKCS
jgi:ribosomal protein S14